MRNVKEIQPGQLANPFPPFSDDARKKTLFWEVVPYTRRLQMMHFESIINLGFLLFKRLSKVIDIVTAYGDIWLKFKASELHL